MLALNRLSLFSIMLLTFLSGWCQIQAANVNPNPCLDWTCIIDAKVTKVTLAGPVALKVGQEGTWTATATTQNGSQYCNSTGESRTCYVTGETWVISAENQSNATNTITRSWTTPGTYTISATGSPVSSCCPGTGSGTSGNMSVVVGCNPATDVVSVEYTFPDMETYLDKAEKFFANIPWVKKFEASVGVTIAASVGQECCPGSSAPTSYTELGGKATGSATLEVIMPPPAGTAGVFAFSVSTPAVKWVGIDSHEIFRAYGDWKLGLYAGLAGKVEYDVTGKVIGECDKCVEGTITIAGTVTVGLVASGNGVLSVAGGAIGAEVAVSGDAKASTSLIFSAKGPMYGDCPAKICGNMEYGDLKSSVSVTAKVKAGKWANVSFSWELPGPSAEADTKGPFCF